MLEMSRGGIAPPLFVTFATLNCSQVSTSKASPMDKREGLGLTHNPSRCARSADSLRATQEGGQHAAAGGGLHALC